MVDDGSGEFGTVEQGEVGADADGRHQVGGVAEQGDAGDAPPRVGSGKDEHGPVDETALVVAQDGQQALVPALVLGEEAGAYGFGVGEVEAGVPVLGAAEVDVGADVSVAVALEHQAAAAALADMVPRPTRRAMPG